MTIYSNSKDAGTDILNSLDKFRRSSPGEPRIAEIRSSKTNGRIENIKVPVEGDLSESARTVIDKVRVLRSYTIETGFKTTRSQNDLLQSLDGDDLANALLVLKYQR